MAPLGKNAKGLSITSGRPCRAFRLWRFCAIAMTTLAQSITTAGQTIHLSGSGQSGRLLPESMYPDSPLGVGDLDHGAISKRIHSVDMGTGWEPLLNRELPPTILAGSCVGWTVQAVRTNSRIDR